MQVMQYTKQPVICVLARIVQPIVILFPVQYLMAFTVLAYKLTKPQNNDTPLDRQVDKVQI